MKAEIKNKNYHKKSQRQKLILLEKLVKINKLLDNYLKRKEKVMSQMHTIRNASLQMQKMIDKLLQFVKKNSGNWKETRECLFTVHICAI